MPGWTYLEPDFRDDLAKYALSGGRLVLLGEGPAKLFQQELAAFTGDSITVANERDGALSAVLRRVFPEPIVEVTGAKDVDVSPRILNDGLSIHLVNTSGPHANPPEGGITEVTPLGPLQVSIRLEERPKSIRVQPEDESLSVTWSQGQAQVTVDQLGLYSILMVEP